MKKKIIGIGFVFLFLCTSWFGIAAAEMSDWAEDEINLALAQDMIPTVLQKDYQNQIRRYEYVLLALQIYEENHPNIQPTYASPFTDTINHQYEEQIAKAFEVGIIQGNGDGTFRPDH
ncbi:MAG: S-layer homology domain-containing protein, partial [Vallitaleaceae bacterium]|nr:S-layer homology domain-containing protein [Vallitaleaceae bacterium]